MPLWPERLKAEGYRSLKPMRLVVEGSATLRLSYRGWTLVAHDRKGTSWFAHEGEGQYYRCVTGPSPTALVRGIDARNPPFTTRPLETLEDSAVRFAKEALGLK